MTTSSVKTKSAVGRPRIVVSDRMAGLVDGTGRPVLARLESRTSCSIWPGPGPMPHERLVEEVKDAVGLLCLLTDRIDAALLASAQQLRVVSTVSVGVDHIDIAAARERGVRVGHTPGVLTETTADLAFALMLAAARRIVESDAFLRQGGWQDATRWSLDMFVGKDVHGATLGVVGLGAIGQAMARRAAGFGMEVIGWSRTQKMLPGIALTSLSDLLERADFVSIHLALTEDTRGLIGTDALARMKRDAVLINTARGGIVDEAALLEALLQGEIAAAALDVFAREPVHPDDPLIHQPNVVLTPHIGSASVATRTRMLSMAVDNLLAGLFDEAMPAEVGPD